MDRTLVIILFSIFIVACTPRWYSGPSPISPEMPTLNEFDKEGTNHPLINTLQPEFSWEETRDQDGQTYDLCIWEAFDLNYSEEEEALLGTGKRNRWGKEVFCETSIADTKFKLSQQLEPNTYYRWSVRLRQGDQVYGWSTFRFGGGFGSGSNYAFGFKTPAQ